MHKIQDGGSRHDYMCLYLVLHDAGEVVSCCAVVVVHCSSSSSRRCVIQVAVDTESVVRRGKTLFLVQLTLLMETFRRQILVPVDTR